MPATILKARVRGRTISASGPDRGTAAQRLAREVQRVTGLILDAKTLRTSGAVFHDPRRGRTFTKFAEADRPQFAPGGPARRYDDPAGNTPVHLGQADLLAILADCGVNTELLGDLSEEQLAEIVRVLDSYRSDAKQAERQLSDPAQDLETAGQFCERFSEDLSRLGISRADVLGAVRTASPQQRRELIADYKRHLAR